MPTYEYECDSCHYRFEKKQSIHAKPVAICPRCRGRVRRVFHSTPVIFKGSGFYITDNRKGAPQPEKAKEKPTDKKGEKK